MQRIRAEQIEPGLADGESYDDLPRHAGQMEPARESPGGHAGDDHHRQRQKGAGPMEVKLGEQRPQRLSHRSAQSKR